MLDLADAATDARADLKAAWPGVRFSVRIHRTDTALTIRWTDGPTESDVRELLARYKGWHRDPSNGSRVPRSDRPETAVARHIDTSRTASPDRARAIAQGIRADNPTVRFTNPDDPFNDTQTAPEHIRFEGRRYYRPWDHADLGMIARRIFSSTAA